MWQFRMFYMEPPIEQKKIPMPLEFEAINFDNAYQFSKEWVQENKKEGTQILMLAQLNR